MIRSIRHFPYRDPYSNICEVEKGREQICNHPRGCLKNPACPKYLDAFKKGIVNDPEVPIVFDRRTD